MGDLMESTNQSIDAVDEATRDILTDPASAGNPASQAEWLLREYSRLMRREAEVKRREVAGSSKGAVSKPPRWSDITEQD